MKWECDTEFRVTGCHLAWSNHSGRAKLLCFWPDFFSLTCMEGEKSFFFVYCNALSNKKRKTVRQGGVAVELYVNKDGSLGRHRYPASLVLTAEANTKCLHVSTPIMQQTQNHPPAGSWVLRASLLLTLALWSLATSVAITLNIFFSHGSSMKHLLC